MKGFKRIATVVKHSHCVSADLLTLVASDTKFDRICFGFVCGQTCSRDDGMMWGIGKTFATWNFASLEQNLKVDSSELCLFRDAWHHEVRKEG